MNAQSIVTLCVAAGGLLLQGVVGWVMLQVVRQEVTALRERSHVHANMLASHGGALDDHERRIGRLEDWKDGRGTH